MSTEPFGITTYCDDFRSEVGGKFTLVGCYSGEMTIFGKAPATLPILCAVTNIILPIEGNFNSLEIVIKKELNGVADEIFRANVNVQDQTEAARGTVDTIEGKNISVFFPTKFSPLVVEGEGFIRTRAYLDGKEIRLGSLAIKFSPLPE